MENFYSHKISLNRFGEYENPEMKNDTCYSKPVSSKEIEKQVEEFLKQGGEIQHISSRRRK